MKSLLAPSVAVLLLACAPALAIDTTIFTNTEGGAPSADQNTISLEGFNGGVSTADTHDGGEAMVIQMLVPNTASAVTAAPGPFVARAAVSGSAH